MTGRLQETALVDLREDSVQDALGRILDQLDADTGTVHKLGNDGQLHLEAHAGGIPAKLLQIIARIPVGKGMAGAAAERLEPVQTCDLQADAGNTIRPGAKATGVRGSVCVPMMNGGRLAGVLGVAVRNEREFSDTEVSWLVAAGKALAALGKD